MTTLPSIDRIRELFEYAPKTGVFTRRTARGDQRAGAVAGHVRKDGYVNIKIDGHDVRAHRLAWAYVHGQWPIGVIDHKDGDRANNRLKNLRVVTVADNCAAKLRGWGKVPFKGVSIGRGPRPFRAVIRANKKHYNLGNFATAEEAAKAYDAAARRLHGVNARTNN